MIIRFAEILFLFLIFFSQVGSETQVESSLYFGSEIRVAYILVVEFKLRVAYLLVMEFQLRVAYILVVEFKLRVAHILVVKLLEFEKTLERKIDFTHDMKYDS